MDTSRTHPLTCRICGGRVPPPDRDSGSILQEAPAVTHPDGTRPEGTRDAAHVPAAETSKDPPAPRQDGSPAIEMVDLDEAAAPSPAAALPFPAPAIVTCPHCNSSFVPGFQPRPAAVQVERPSDPDQKTILIVEDTEFFLQLARETLGKPYKTICARTASEALSILQDERVDLLVLDLALEAEEDGLDVLTDAFPRGLPCLVFTAKSEAEMWGDGWIRLRGMGASDLLLKGMNIEEQLLSKVAALLSASIA
jgi:CheY-like chemotaxis protein